MAQPGVFITSEILSWKTARFVTFALSVIHVVLYGVTRLCLCFSIYKQ